MVVAVSVAVAVAVAVAVMQWDIVGCSGESDGDSDVGLSAYRLAMLQLFYLYIEFFIPDRCWYIYIVHIYSTTEELQTINITNISRGIYVSKTEGYLGMKMECINNRL